MEIIKTSIDNVLIIEPRVFKALDKKLGSRVRIPTGIE